MKRLLLAALAAGTTLSACSKKADDTPEPVICIFPAPSGLVSEWDWVASKGGLTGKQELTPTTTGVATRWVFGADSTFQQYDTRQGVTTLTETTTYSLGTARSIYTGQPARQLTIQRHVGGSPTAPVRPEKYIVQALGNQLVVADNYADGFTHTYQRR